jgi:hypothetical protein
VIARTKRFLLHLNDLIEGLLQPDPQGHIASSCPTPSVKTVQESPSNQAPDGTTIITVDDLPLHDDICPATMSTHVEISEIHQCRSPNDNFPTSSDAHIHIVPDPPVHPPTTIPDPLPATSVPPSAHTSGDMSLPSLEPTEPPEDSLPSPTTLRKRLNKLDPCKEPQPTKFVPTNDPKKVLLTKAS